MKSLITPRRSAEALAFVLTVLLTGTIAADTVKTKDGKTWEGTILAEDASSVTIRYLLKPTIPDTKIIARTDIVSIEKKSPDDIEAEAVKKLLPSEDFLLPSAYQKLINEGPAKFLAAHPTSKHRAEIEVVKKTLEEEMAKSRLGQRKVDGKWLNGQEIQANEYNINAMRALRKMEKLAAADDYRGALNAFVELETGGKLSVSYPKAIELAKTTLEKYAASLARDIKSQPQKLKDAEDKLGKMVPDEVRRAKAEREKQKKDFTAMLAEEKKQKVRFTSVMDIDLPSMTDATKQVEVETKRLATLNVPAITETAGGYDKILQLVGQKKFEEASVRLEEFVKNTKTAASDPQIKLQLEKLKEQRAESVRQDRQRELLNRTQPKPVETTKPTGTPGVK